MKSLTAAILATLAGTAMVALGIAGAAGSFDSKDDGGSGSSSASSSAAPDDCSRLDPRLSTFNAYQSFLADGSNVRILVSCDAGDINVSAIGSGLRPEAPRTLALWAWRTRRDAVVVGTYPQAADDDGTVVFGGTMPSDSEHYTKLVVTIQDEGDTDPQRPGRIVSQNDIDTQ
jgi:hypothetical protein